MKSEQNPIEWKVYTPTSPLRHPIALVKEILGDLRNSRELIWILFLRDLKAAYRQSMLGYAWLFIPPLATTAIWMFLSSQKIVSVGETPIPYPLYVLIGTALWNGFSRTVTGTLDAYSAGQPIFTKLNVSFEAFILAGTARASFDFSIYTLLFIPVFIAYDFVPPLTALLFPVAVAGLFLLGATIGFLLLPLASLYTDVKRAIAVILGFAMYLSPVVYPPPADGWAATLVNLNPATPCLMAARDLLTTGPTSYTGALALVTLGSFLIFALSVVALRVAKPHLIARMGM
jgi:lipopolysaccharide transport system permease protein